MPDVIAATRDLLTHYLVLYCVSVCAKYMYDRTPPLLFVVDIREIQFVQENKTNYESMQHFCCVLQPIAGL